MKFDTVIFDMDGTLLNTLDDITDSINEALKECGYPARDREEVKSFVGNGGRRLVFLALPEGAGECEIEDCLARFRSRYAINMRRKTRPYEGITGLLSELKRLKIKTAVVSNKFEPSLKELCSDIFPSLISVVIGDSDGTRRKPAPDSVLKAIKELGSQKERTVYVGDSDTDVETAKNAGIVCVGAAWGFRGRGVLEDKGADYIIDAPEELLGIPGFIK
ncbi:MAG: HAD family hydrolase [Bacillota bacterium]|nr:HAD family hydrolase [Bacillota bacterium]